MNVTRMIKEICCCLEALLCEDCYDNNNQQFKDGKDAIIYNLKIKVHAALEKVKGYPEIKRNVIDSIQACSVEKCSCDHLTFLQMCLILLRLLQKTLSEEIDSSLMSSTQKNGEKLTLLSVSQLNVLKKCFQFIVGLGILPNLMCGLKIPLSSRLQHANIFENFSNDSSCYQKHAQLVVSLETLLDCLEYDAMLSTLLNYYGTYMLAALVQLCHAPIKRVKKSEIAAVTLSPSHKIEFQTMLTAVRDNSDHSEWEIVSLMLLHQNHFEKCLEKFLSKISLSLLMWELILFLGIPVQNVRFQKRKLARYPNWMRKICHEMLMRLLYQNHGIVSLIQAVLDKAFDVDAENGNVDGKQLEAVALLITHLVQDDNLESYVQKLSKQVFQLLHLKESQMNSPLKFTASCMILQFYERNQILGKNYFLKKILDPLQKCVNFHDNKKADIIVDENELTKFIEDLHQIFTSTSLPLKKKSIDILFPFFHCLTSLYFFLFKGTLFLKCKVKDLLIEILSAASSTDALHLLSVVTIPSYINKDVLTPTVSFAYGDEGGVIAVVKKSSDNTDEDFCCNALLNLISELHNKELNSGFILQIVKEYCNFHLRAKEYPLNVNLKTQSAFSTLLHELSEWNVDVGEALVSNISEVMELIMALLDNISNYDFDALFHEETAMVVLVILNSLITCENHVLSTNDWQCIKKCLPSLQKLKKCGIDSSLKEMLMSITIHIATQGVCSIEEEDSMAEILNNCSDLNNQILESNLESQNACNSLSKNVIDNTLSNEEVKTAFNVLEELDSQNECYLKECTDKPKIQNHNVKEKDFKYHPKRTSNYGSVIKSKTLSVSKCSDYEKAFKEANDKDIPIQGNGLINLGKLIQKRDEEAILNKAKIFQIFQEGIKHEDSYIYLSAIQGISYLADLDTEMVLPTVLKIFQVTEENCDVIVNVGEVLLKICRLLGDMIYKYRDQLLHAYLIGSKNPYPKIRTSSLSNLGEVCMYLKFDISNYLQEILECVLSLLKTDKDLEVRRCSVMVISLLLRGMGKDMLKILPGDIHKIYRQLKFVRDTESDEVLCLHSDLAIQEIDSNMKDLFNPSSLLTKEIKILP